MDYIVNPSWFYWLQVISYIQTWVFALAILLTLGSVLAIIFTILEYHLGSEWQFDVDEHGIPTDSDYRLYLLWKKVAKILSPIAIVVIIVSLFIPSKETIISMMIAKYATKENLNMSVDAIKSAVDYIVNAIKEVK